LQAVWQRCPRNSVEQLGQIENASFFGFAGARFDPKAKLPVLHGAQSTVAPPQQRLYFFPSRTYADHSAISKFLITFSPTGCCRTNATAEKMP
jgi:hypothetical protein